MSSDRVKVKLPNRKVAVLFIQDKKRVLRAIPDPAGLHNRFCVVAPGQMASGNLDWRSRRRWRELERLIFAFEMFWHVRSRPVKNDPQNRMRNRL